MRLWLRFARAGNEAINEWNKDPWDYDPDTLHTLCDECHERAESVRKAASKTFGMLSQQDGVIALGFMAGLKVQSEARISDYPDGYQIGFEQSLILLREMHRI